MKINAILSYFFIFVALTACGTKPENPNVVLLCSVNKYESGYSFPLEKILFNQSGLDLKFKIGSDVSGYGLKYRGDEKHIFPDRLIAFFFVVKDKKTGQLKIQLVRTLTVINDRIPALDNQLVSDFEKSLQ